MESKLINKIGVVGLGNFGTALAHWLAHHFTVIGWTHTQESADEINQKHTNEKYLPNYNLHVNLQASTNITEVVTEAPIIFICLHARYIPELAIKMMAAIPNKCVIVNSSKGMIYDPGITVFDYLAQAFAGKAEILHMAGPMVANEFSKSAKTIGVMIRPHSVSRDTLSQLFAGTPLAVTFSTDIQGLLWGSILKNIYAIGFGVLEVVAVDNINMKGIYITQAFQEMLRFAQDKGGYSETISGLPGLGDFMATSLSVHSNNHRFGNEIAQKVRNQEKIDVTSGPEGIYAIRTLAKIEGAGWQRYPIMSGLWQLMNGEIGLNQWLTVIEEKGLSGDRKP